MAPASRPRRSTPKTRTVRGAGHKPAGLGGQKRILLAAFALVLVAVAAWLVRGGPHKFFGRLSLTGDQIPPVILISIDTLRADYLGCYGGTRVATPNIDALAQLGTLFSQASAQVPLTLPSHVSMLTSTYPFANGIEDNGEHFGADGLTLAEVMQANGYRTAAFVGGFVLDRRFGLDQGFDRYDSPFEAPTERAADPTDLKRLGEDVVQAAQSWIAGNAGSPFFVFLHLFDLHTPDNLPPAVRARFPGPRYEAELAYVDELLGGFWAFLEERDLLRKSLIIFTSDHGEGLGDHRESSHGYFIYQSTLRVPLIIHWPSGAGPYPERFDGPTSLLGVAPTVLELTSIDRPHEFQGLSLLGRLAKDSQVAAEAVYGESHYGQRHFGTSSLFSLRLGRYKFIEAPSPELYDLEADPGETTNVYEQERELADTHRSRLEELRSQFGRANRGSESVPDPETIRRLRSLGYLSSAKAPSPTAGTLPDPKNRIDEYENYRRAATLATLGRLEESNRLLRGVLAEAPELADVWSVLGLNQERQGDFQAAAASYRKVLELDPMDALAHYSLGICYSRLNRWDDAARELEAALVSARGAGSALHHVSVPAHEALGALWIQRQQYQRAREVFEGLTAFDPGNFEAHYNLGWLAARDETLDVAVRHLQEALRTDPASATARNALGGLYLRQQRLDLAAAELGKAVELDPQSEWAHYNLGLVLGKQGKRSDAQRHLQQALALNPGLRPARDALAALQTAE